MGELNCPMIILLRPFAMAYNLFVTSKNETTISPIHQFTNLKCFKMSYPSGIVQKKFVRTNFLTEFNIF